MQISGYLVELTEENKTAFREAAYKHIQMFFMEMGGNR